MGRRRLPATDAAADRLAAALDDVAGSDASAIAMRWRQLFAADPPIGLSHALRARVIAYRLQARLLGDLDRNTAQALDRLGAVRAGRSPGVAAASVTLPVPDRRGQLPGALLTREWAGTMHTVTVLHAGYAWYGSNYDSLSAIAQAITGTKWNGPRFFGLRERAKPAEPTRRADVRPGITASRPAA